MRYLYLHGLASGPQSAKAKYLRDRFRSRGLALELPDFNLGDDGRFDFAGLTLTRKITQTREWIGRSPGPITLIGSSLGGLAAAWTAQGCPAVERLVLLAPAFDFLVAWLPALGREGVRHWRTAGAIEQFHHGLGQPQALGYGFVTDLEGYDEAQLSRVVPTVILHGRRDETIPIQASRRFAGDRDWVQLIELESDHGLGNSVSRIWQEIEQFCGLSLG